MIIRSAQVKAFENTAEASFTQEGVEHLRAYDPLLSRAAGEEGLRKTAAAGMQKAKRYGLDQRGPIFLILELMASLGCAFDDDPQYYWFRPLLESPDDMSPLDRASRLQWHAVSFLDRAYGQTGEWGRAALERVASLQWKHLAEIGRNYPAKTLPFLRWIHPQKVEFAGEQAFASLPSAAASAAQTYGVVPPEGPVLLLLLMFAFGHKVFDDALYPWLRRTLEEPAMDNPRRRLERLHERAETYVRQMLAQLGGAQT